MLTFSPTIHSLRIYNLLPTYSVMYPLPFYWVRHCSGLVGNTRVLSAQYNIDKGTDSILNRVKVNKNRSQTLCTLVSEKEIEKIEHFYTLFRCQSWNLIGILGMHGVGRLIVVATATSPKGWFWWNLWETNYVLYF